MISSLGLKLLLRIPLGSREVICNTFVIFEVKLWVMRGKAPKKVLVCMIQSTTCINSLASPRTRKLVEPKQKVISKILMLRLV